MANRVDGVIAAVSHETDTTDHFQPLADRGIPLIFFDRVRNDMPHASSVATNNYEITKAATLHLINEGCKRIAFVAGPMHLANSAERLRGYYEALRVSSLPVVDSLVVHATYQGEQAADHVRYLLNLQQPPDAIFAINDQSALEMMYHLKLAGFRVPKDVAIMGFNNDRMGQFFEPTLSIINYPAHQMGMAAAEILINHIRHPEQKPLHRVVTSELVVRQSSRRSA